MGECKNDSYYLSKIVTDLGFLLEHTKGLTKAQMQKDEVLLDCIMFRLVQISENSDRLTDEFKARYSDVSWRAIKGLRNRIVHDYGTVDISIIFDTVAGDIPTLYDILVGLV
ncbi:MAG: DUF86 domain-containing protein [Clostridiales bacterium]|nr:DUF86 domain-containing protein [Clostridiales bacterium]